MKKAILLTFLLISLLSCTFFEEENKEEKENNTIIESEKINPIWWEAVWNIETTTSELKNSLDFNN